MFKSGAKVGKTRVRRMLESNLAFPGPFLLLYENCLLQFHLKSERVIHLKLRIQ